jgi:hypothetical protein
MSISDTGMSEGATVLPREYHTVPTLMRACEEETTGSWLSDSPGWVPPAMTESTDRASTSAWARPADCRRLVRYVRLAT